MQTKEENIINVPSIEPRLKHATIFKAFEELKPGESFIIHNDHDPKPLYYQLSDIHGDTFKWEYLQQGPEWFDIRVTLLKNIRETEELVIDVPSIEPRYKHETIFGAFDSLAPGESLIIHNDHDPKPLYYQLQNMHGDIFTWEYINEGPEWWDIRVTIRDDIYYDDDDVVKGAKEGEKIINVPSLEPKIKHATIFKSIEDLQPGESLIIHNDHDPKPLQYHLMDQYGGEQLGWEYLRQGPTWWDVRITIKPQANQNRKDLVINVPSIEPRLKHQTIFNVFKSTKPGESFVIHNDHDPRPVYYQLAQIYGEEAFTWEYLQQGPDWWDIRVTIKDQEEESNQLQGVAKNADGHLVVTVPSIEPRYKHPTIFKVFDMLGENESMIIHNDHDPKPVYYQLQNERGDGFTWEYLQEGPDWWDIKITIKPRDTGETIGDIVAKDLGKSEVFKKYGIDFCCNGKKTVKQACDSLSIDYRIVEQELRQTQSSAQGSYTNYSEWNIGFLADYVVNTHHAYLRNKLPEIKGYAAKVAQVHGAHHPELLKINDLYREVHDEFLAHIQEEEGIIFPKVKDIANGRKPKGDPFADLVKDAEAEHQSVGDKLDRIREISNNFEVPADGCTSYKLFYKMLDELEEDTHIHIHLENNIMFPKAVEIEKTLS
ncbi:MAG: iron-sulfur cluster repair di-iron protein [Chitinophagales bacterium]|nr:iron-sulfur cluster repair di-iron protein [Chitinophagales bacterium]